MTEQDPREFDDLGRQLRAEFTALTPSADSVRAHAAADQAMSGTARTRRWLAPVAAAAAVAALGLGGFALADVHHSDAGRPAAGSLPPSPACTTVPMPNIVPASAAIPPSGSAPANSLVTATVSSDANGDATITVAGVGSPLSPLVLIGVRADTIAQALAIVDQSITDVDVRFTNGTALTYRYLPDSARWINPDGSAPKPASVPASGPTAPSAPSSTDSSALPCTPATPPTGTASGPSGSDSGSGSGTSPMTPTGIPTAPPSTVGTTPAQTGPSTSIPCGPPIGVPTPVGSQSTVPGC